MIRLILIEHHQLVAETISAVIKSYAGIELLATTKLEKAVKVARQLKPDLVLMEIASPEMNGLGIANKLATMPLKVVVLTQYTHTAYLTHALKSGAIGYVTKYSANEELLRAIETCHTGDTYVIPELAEKLAWNVVNQVEAPFSMLSTREFQMMMMFAHAKKVPEIAKSLWMSEKTVSSYHSRILQRIDVNTDAELVQLLYREGLLEFIA